LHIKVKITTILYDGLVNLGATRPSESMAGRIEKMSIAEVADGRDIVEYFCI
jgi:hypothetical protein